MGCIWKVSEDDRLCRYCTRIVKCTSVKRDCVLKSTEYVEAMNTLVGSDIRKRGNYWKVARCRFMVMYRMSLDGFSQDVIGEAVCRARCLVSYANSVMADFLSVPWSYPWEMEMWQKYEETINLMKDERIKENSEVVAV